MNDPERRDYTHLGLRMNKKKTKDQSLMPGFTPELYVQAGAIALTWGTYELLFDRLLGALVLATEDTSEPGWRVLDYKRRRRLCRRLVIRHFQLRPKLRDFLFKVLDDSIAIQSVRNGILHGKTAGRLTAMPDGTMLCELIVEARKGTSKPVAYTADDLETIAHDLYHLGGRLNLSFKMSVQGLSLRDMRALEDLLSLVPIETILPEFSGLP